MSSEFGKRLRQTFIEAGTKGIAVAGTAQFGPIWGLVDPFVRHAVSFFAEPPADRAIAALLAKWEKDDEAKARLDEALDRLHDQTMRDLAAGFAVLEQLDVQRKGERETLCRQAVCASLAGVYFALSLTETQRYLRIIGVSEAIISHPPQDPEYLSMIRDSLSCQIHPLGRFAFEVGLCSVMAAQDIDVARVNLTNAARWVGLGSLVDPYMQDLQPFLDAKDQEGLITLVKDFAAGAVAFAGVPSPPS